MSEETTSSASPPRLPEAVRVAVEVARSALAALSAEHRHLAHDQLGLVLAKQLTAQDAEVASLRQELASLRDHNAQRHEEVWAARELLGARPDETLLTAIRRALDVVLSFKAEDGRVLYATRVGRGVGEFRITDERVASVAFAGVEGGSS